MKLSDLTKDYSKHTRHIKILPRLCQAQGIFICHGKRSQFLEPTSLVGLQKSVPGSLEERRLLQPFLTAGYRVGCLLHDHILDGIV